MMQSPYAFSRRPARAFHLRIFTAALFAALLAGPSVAQLDESCVVGALNRIAPVRPDGTWVLPNVPDNMGLIRVRATCVENGVTRFGQSDLIAVPTNGVLRVEEIHFDQMALVPSRLELDAPRTVLSSVGESVQLTTTAFFPDASTTDVTAGATGTSYTISNPRVASVGSDGLLTALSSGSVVVTAANEGATSFLFFQIVVSADSDGDGLPDDFEVANGLDPNDPLDAQMDQDRDGLTTLAEFLIGLDPRNPDTDGDTLLDGEEDAYLTDPLLFDTDGDGLSDGLEVLLGSDPTDPNDFDLAGALTAITISPAAFNLVFNSVLGEASIQLAVSGLLIDGNTLDLTARGTTYTSSDLTVCSFGAAPGRIFAGVDGACTITAENSGFSAQASGTVSSFQPLPLARITLPGSTHNVDVNGDFAYVAAGSAGLVVVDVNDPATPTIAATADTPGNARDVKVVGGVAYIADGSAGLRLFDVSTPTAPASLGALDTPGDARDVEVRGSLAYVADGLQGMRIIDVGNPAAPALVGAIGALGTLGTVNGVDVGPATGIAVAAAGSRLRVIDISSPALPVLLGTATIGGNAQAVVLRDGYAHVADLSRSLTVVDVRDPATPLVGVSTPRETGGLLNDVTRVGDLLFGSDIFFVNGVPILNAGLPSSPVTTAILDFRAFGDDNGTGIAANGQLVFLTTDRSRLMIGQYLSLQDAEGLAPSVTLTAPAEDATPLAGSRLDVTADASDDVAVAQVDFLVDGEVVLTDFTRPYELSLTVPVGTSEITLGARAVDYGNNVGVAEDVVLTVLPDLDAPVIGAVTPTAGTPFTSGDAMLLSAEVSDNVAVTEVVFQVGTRTYVDTAAPYAVTVSTPPVFSSTELAIRVEAGDPSGNRTAVDFTVPVEPIEDTEPPRPRFLFPGDGDAVLPGEELTVELEITDDHFLDSYSLTLDGEVIGSQAFIEQPFFADQVPLNVPADALPGQSFTLRLEASDFGANAGAAELTLVVIDGGNVLTGNQNLDSSYDGQDLVLGAGTFTAVEPLQLASLTLLNGARLVGVTGQTLAVSVTGTLQLGTGATIDGDSRGFAGGGSGHNAGFAPDGISAARPDAGGSHGGTGVTYTGAGPAGEVYDSVYAPRLAGGGGARDEDNTGDGHPGGGVIDLDAGRLVVNGTIRARGGGGPSGVRNRAGGAGGSIVVTTGELAGSGLIDASGGSSAASFNSERAGAGGGGRVAIYADQLTGFDPITQTTAQGGARFFNTARGYAAPGTVLIRDSAAVHGRLLIDNGTAGGNERRGPSTALPPLGAGTVTALDASGADAWLTADAALPVRWVGASVRLLDAVDGALGVFRVLDRDASGRLLLAGAAGVAGAASYEGLYRFDRVDLLHGAGLISDDELVVGDFNAEGRARLPAAMTVDNLTIRGGAVVTPSTGGTLRTLINDTLTVEDGARIDVTALGYAGGRSGSNSGSAPAGIVAAGPDAGGSHGGTGTTNTGGGPLGEVYDSVYVPHLAGGGGARDEDNSGDGQSGGGVLDLTAAHLVLDGELRARGGDGERNRAGGAGGSVLLRVATLSGTGAIDTSGGSSTASFSSEQTGAGGGGRVAIYADQLAGFDPESQVRARAGGRYFGSLQGYSAPGTIYVFTSASTFGDLLVDSGEDGDGNDRRGPSTELPLLGEGNVLAFEASGDDAWLTAATDFKARWLGAFARMHDAAGQDLGSFKVLALDGARILLEGAGNVVGAASFAGSYRFDRVDLLNGAGLSSQDELIGRDFEVREGQARLPVALSVERLTLLSGALVIPTTGGTIEATVSDTFTVEAGARLDTSARGHAGGRSGHTDGFAPDGISPSRPDAGGSHGGTGIVYTGAGPAGEVYDSVYAPQLAGGGGARDEDTSGDGQSGGGVLHITAGRLVLDGELWARGGGGTSGVRNRAGGAGGSVLLDVGVLEGTGVVDASGGASAASFNSERNGAGGGGRVAIYTDELVGFDPVAQVRVQGGARFFGAANAYAAPGTLYVFRSGDSTYGDLVIDNGQSDGADRVGPVTLLPTLGSGAVTALDDAGADAWLTTGSALQTRWLGAFVELADSAGQELGIFRVTALDGARALLQGAAGTVGAASFSGKYRFDAVDLRHGAGVATEDELIGMDLEVLPGNAELPINLVVDNLTLRTGAVARPASGGRLTLTVNGLLTIEAGARLDVTGLGHSGGVSGHNNGEAPAGIAPAEPDAGGSHGGTGIRYTGTGALGEVYDSVYAPQLAGGGGARDEDNSGDGRPGGGVIDITAGGIVLDGEIRARGAGSTSARNRAGGAGGTVLIDTGTFDGGGLIDASGGASAASFNSERTGAGGGGRVAIYADQLLGFDPVSQVRVQGGARTFGAANGYGAPGTLYVFRDGDSTYGDLVIDSGEDEGSDRDGPSTELPVLGSGAVTLLEPAGGDAWLSSGAAFKTRWQGAWARLQDATDSELGTFRVLSIDAAGRALLEGGAAAPSAVGFSGLYRFDDVELRNGAGLTTSDELEIGATFSLFPGSTQVPATFSASDMTLFSGAVAVPAKGGVLRARVSGTLTLAAGSRLDVSERGHAGGRSGHNAGEAPPGVAPAQPDAGGSHGGLGVTYTGAGPVGEAYDSIFWPRLSGGGGARDEDNSGDGRAGGGVIELDVGQLVLDGEIRARGGGGTTGVRNEAGGAGGTVLIQAGTLSGSGLIDASGGASAASFNSERSGAGGGGRVALHVGQFDGFDPFLQTRVRGGGRFFGSVNRFAGSGTVYLSDASSIFGDLLVDQGGNAGQPVGRTPLPSIGSGTVGAVAPDVVDPTALWIEPQDPATTFDVGVDGMVVRILGVDYPVVAQTADRRGLLLEGAAGIVDVGDAYQGVYKLDTVTVRGGAVLVFDDEPDVGGFDVDPDSQVIDNSP